ncbi:MAG: hypothetical protein ACMUIM_02745 [bacterium]
MYVRKAIAVSCIIFFGLVILCLNMPAMSQYLPWSWRPASPFPPISQIPINTWPQPSYFPTVSQFPSSSGWPPYLPPPGYSSSSTSSTTSTVGGCCPCGLVTGLTLDEEFGPGASQITRCLVMRYNIKVVYRLNHLEYTPGTPITRTIQTAIDDYKITSGTSDFKIAAIIHSAGLPLALNRNTATPHPEAIYNDQQPVIEDLIARGVKFYL